MSIVASMSGNTAYVLDVGYQVRAEIPWQEAITHILQGKMTPILVHPEKRIRNFSGEVDIALPLIVRLKDYVYIPSAATPALHHYASRSDILKRDKRTCCYCLKSANTVDHIKPESRAKRDGDPFNGWTWGNLVAACFKCNNKKSDRTPEEANMKMRWEPRAGWDRFGQIQKEVWRILESETGGFVEEAIQYEGLLAG